MGKARDEMVRGTASECNFTGCELAIPRLINNAIEANHSVDKGLVCHGQMSRFVAVFLKR